MVKGYKVFDPDWTCSGKQYTCPGKFEEKGELEVCGHGMHFCQTAADCFNYCRFDSKNKVAEVIAYGEVKTDGDRVAATPGIRTLETGTPGTATPGTGTPGTGTPGTTTPGTGTPGTRTLETGTPGTGTLETGTPGTTTPVAATPGTVTPGTGTPGTGTPGTGTPGTGTPGTGTLEISMPGTGTPGTATPEIGTNLLLILAVLTQKNRKLCCSISRRI